MIRQKSGSVSESVSALQIPRERTISNPHSKTDCDPDPEGPGVADEHSSISSLGFEVQWGFCVLRRVHCR